MGNPNEKAIMTMVYVVTSGDYSDYGIEGMFSDRAKADALAAHGPANGHGAARVVEYPVNVAVDERFGRRAPAALVRHA